MVWISFGALPCRGKSWWQLASRCCWNRARPWHASELFSFLVGLRTYQHPCISPSTRRHIPKAFVASTMAPKFLVGKSAVLCIQRHWTQEVCALNLNIWLYSWFWNIYFVITKQGSGVTYSSNYDYYYYHHHHHHHLLYAGYLYLYSWDKLCP